MYSGKQALRLEKFKASDIGGLDKELKERKGVIRVICENPKHKQRQG